MPFLPLPAWEARTTPRVCPLTQQRPRHHIPNLYSNPVPCQRLRPTDQSLLEAPLRLTKGQKGSGWKVAGRPYSLTAEGGSGSLLLALSSPLQRLGTGNIMLPNSSARNGLHCLL